MNHLLISFVIPTYNEQQNIETMLQTLQAIMVETPYRYEVLFVDDGSSDGTIDEIYRLHDAYPEMEYISFTRNFGKEAAILAGLQHATGDAIVLMDADLQHPPQLVPQMIEQFEKGYEQVIAKRNRVGDDKIRSLSSRLFYWSVNKTVDVELRDGEGDFRLLSRRAVDYLLQLNESNRFSKGLYSWIGLKQTTINYDNVLRQNGETKWSFKQLLNYAVDGMISFNTKPLRICFYIGLLSMLLAISYIIVTLFDILKNGVEVPGYFTTISAVLFLGGVQLLSIGIIGEYIGRIYNETKQRPHYLVQEASSQRKGNTSIHVKI